MHGHTSFSSAWSHITIRLDAHCVFSKVRHDLKTILPGHGVLKCFAALHPRRAPRLTVSVSVVEIQHDNMSSHSTVYMFGDQAAFSKNTLRALLRLNQDPILKSFLGQAGSTLRREIQALPWRQREQFPAFVGLSDLLAVDSEKELHPALRLALTTISHLAVYIL